MPVEGREQAILIAAAGVFARLGYRRAAMADIAAAAGVSRTAVYLHFRDKADICRRLTADAVDRAEHAVALALGHDAPPGTALALAFAALATPWSPDPVDPGPAAGLVQDGRDRVAATCADWLAQGAASGLLRLPRGEGAALAPTMLAALDGVLAAALPADRAEAALRLARLFGRALAA